MKEQSLKNPIGRTLVLSLLFLLVSVSSVLAQQGLTGDCYDCHTMHNSEEGKSVALTGDGSGTSLSANPIPTLLKYDCIACHAREPNGGSKIITTDGGSEIPQVMHADASGDLAGGNFRYIAESGNRKGHNVVDLVAAESDMNLDQPPGFRHRNYAVGEGGFDINRFTCAGSMGCHGYRGQVLSSSELFCDEFGNKWIDGVNTGELCSGADYANVGTSHNYRTGLTALSGMDGVGVSASNELKRGAHHQNFEGFKNNGLSPEFYDSPLAQSYRFLRSMRGYGNETDRWQNIDENSHNEYVGGYPETPLGEIVENTDFGSTASCSLCHVAGSINDVNSRLTTPGQSMTGFCLTCHGQYHSSGSTNGSSGAFLRHPSDYVIPDRDEYSAYTVYDVSAPVARPHNALVAGMTDSPTVNPGTDLVMCLSCHVAHASPYDHMLRFDYAAMTAGGYEDIATATGEGGCLACHTEKGVLPQNR